MTTRRRAEESSAPSIVVSPEVVEGRNGADPTGFRMASPLHVARVDTRFSPVAERA